MQHSNFNTDVHGRDIMVLMIVYDDDDVDDEDDDDDGIDDDEATTMTMMMIDKDIDSNLNHANYMYDYCCSVTVHVEDRESAGLVLTDIKVRPSNTILDLKQMVSCFSFYSFDLFIYFYFYYYLFFIYYFILFFFFQQISVVVFLLLLLVFFFFLAKDKRRVLLFCNM
jgi:hypothetical protein